MVGMRVASVLVGGARIWWKGVRNLTRTSTKTLRNQSVHLCQLIHFLPPLLVFYLAGALSSLTLLKRFPNPISSQIRAVCGGDLGRWATWCQGGGQGRLWWRKEQKLVRTIQETPRSVHFFQLLNLFPFLTSPLPRQHSPHSTQALLVGDC